ncbi:MAG: chloride channel protein [Acidimicrobiia bacterium]
MSTNPHRLRGFAQRSRDVVLASALVGVITGLVVAGCEFLTIHILDWVRGLPTWIAAGAPLVGLALAALALRYLAFGANPGLADTWLQAFHSHQDQDVRSAPGSVLSSILTIGFGGAMGLEGLAIYSGGAIGTLMQRRMGWLFRPVDRKVLMTAGAAAGIAAIFKAPATGALFAIEVPFQDDFAHRKLLPCLVAAATGYLGAAAINGTVPLFLAKERGGFDAVHLVGALALGVAAGLGARLFALFIQRAKGLTVSVSFPIRIVGSGIALGALFLIGRATTGRDLMLGPGYDAIHWALDPHRAVPILLLIMVLRILATGVTVAGGGVGGLFVPLVVAGALLGRAAGGLVDRADDTLFTILGVAAFLGAGYRVPLAAVMFVAETTGRATFVVPALIAAVAADLVMGEACVTIYQITGERASD